MALMTRGAVAALSILSSGAPGVYAQAQTRSAEGLDIRTDRSALIGYAEQGPVDVAIKVGSFSHYVEIFGQARPGYLNDSVSSFFANGGSELFVIRVLATTAQTAVAVLDDLHMLCCHAAAPYYLGPGSETAKNALAKYDAADVTGTRRFYRLKSPGRWGNELQLELALNAPLRLAIVQWQPELKTLRLSGIANLEAGTLLDIDGHWAWIEAVDPARQQVTLTSVPQPLLDAVATPQQVLVNELRLRLFFKQQLVEEYQQLALHPAHSRYFIDYINRNSLRIALAVETEMSAVVAGPWHWLDHLSGDYPLQGGQLDLAAVGADDFARAIDKVALEPKIALLAAPDIVYRQTRTQQALRLPLQDNRCDHLLASAEGRLSATVYHIGNEQAVADARVIVRANTPPFTVIETRTSPAGRFGVTGLPAGMATVGIEASGFAPGEFAVTIREHGRLTDEAFGLTPIEQPPQFSAAQMLALQQQLVQQADVLQRHYVILDPPATANKLDAVSHWRFQFDSRLVSLVYPWLTFNESQQQREQPPSALVMGALAGRDLARGLIYATANLPLRSHGQLKHAISAAEHGRLNQAHINCLLLKPGEHIALMGARTLSYERPWRYIGSARLLLFIIQFLQQRMQWAVFEPNNILLRIAISMKLNALLDHLWRKGALQGDKAQQAYRVLCDDSNNNQAGIDAGRLIAEIGLAMTEPQEFIWLVYQRQAEQAEIRVK